MYAHFIGKVDKILADKVIIETNDIGYEIYMPESEMAKLSENEKAKVYTYLHVREDDVRLFGFLSYETLEFFKKLIGVSGVGPKVALGIISNISVGDMCVAIATENIVTLKGIPGIGPKMAQKIIFELKDKVLKDQMQDLKEVSKTKIIKNVNVDEAMTALQVLGYGQAQVRDVISNLNIENESVEDIIRKVLKQMQNI